MKQVKNSFDKATMLKILKGALISATGTIALVVLNYLGTVQFDDPMIAYAVSFVVPNITNAIKEYLAGK